MSNIKFNGWEKAFITLALENEIERAEEAVNKEWSEGVNSIFAPGYFEMVGKELIEKVHNMTLKKDQE